MGESVDALDATKARLLEAPKGRLHAARVPLVYIHRARLQTIRGPVRKLEILGVDACRQAVVRTVGDVQSFFRGVKREHRQHRSEYLLLGNRRIRGDVSDDRGLEVVTLELLGVTAADHGVAASFDRRGAELFRLVALAAGDERREKMILGSRPHRALAHPRYELLGQCLLDTPV